MKTRALLIIWITAFAMLACTIPFALATPTALPAPTALPIRPLVSPTPLLPTPAVASPTIVRAPTPVGSVPAWWTLELAMPQGAEFAGAARDTVMWKTRDLNADGLRDFFVRQAAIAGYTTTVITKSQSAIYDLLVVKGQNAFALNITVGSDTTIITGSRVGVFHLKVTGVANVEVDLPMRNRVDIAPGSEVSIGTSIPSSQCHDCEYFINIHIAPFKGAGTYDSKPGISIIDLQVIPGGALDKEDYRWAQSCVVIVRDAQGGTFECKGLQNVYDQSRKIDVSGSWQQPP